MAECALFCVAREILNLRKENWQSLPEPRVSADDVFMAKATITMDDLLAGDNAKQLVAGEMVTGHVLSVRKHEVLVDLGAQGIGYVPRREVGFGRQLNVGDEVSASVIDSELDNGYSLLSLRKAAKDRGWEEIQAHFDAAERTP